MQKYCYTKDLTENIWPSMTCVGLEYKSCNICAKHATKAPSLFMLVSFWPWLQSVLPLLACENHYWGFQVFFLLFCILSTLLHFIWRLALLNFNGDSVGPLGLGQVHVSRDTSNIIIINNNNNNMNITTILNLTLNNYDGDCGSVWLMSWTRVVAGRAETNLKFKKLKLIYRPT